MAIARGYSLLVQPDQWARCVHDNTALLPDGSVELTWADPPVPAAGPWAPRPSGLAFDRWRRAYRSRPEAGRGDAAAGPPAASCPGAPRSPSRPAADPRRRPYVSRTSGAGGQRDRLAATRRSPTVAIAPSPTLAGTPPP